MSTPSAPDANSNVATPTSSISASVCTCASTPVVRRTGPSQAASVSTWWMPSCMSGPPGFRERCARHACGPSLPGSENVASASTTLPSRPSATSSPTRRAAPSRRKPWPTISTTSVAAHASRIRAAAASVSAIGFSTKTWRPRSAHATAWSAWTSFGVASTTPSTRGSSIAASKLAATGAPSRAAFSPSREKQVTTSSPARRAAATRRGAHIPAPMTAMPFMRGARAPSRPPAGATGTARSRTRGCLPRAPRASRAGPSAPAARSTRRGSAGRAAR